MIFFHFINLRNQWIKNHFKIKVNIKKWEIFAINGFFINKNKTEKIMREKIRNKLRKWNRIQICFKSKEIVNI
jgi:hypothetical protein